MTAAEMAALHARVFTVPPPWRVAAFGAALADSAGVVATNRHGFAIGRVVADEAELLTMAVAPAARRRGLGRRLLAELERRAQGRGATEMHLEVADDNAVAAAFYAVAGYREAGRRPDYYHHPDGRCAAARLLVKRLAP